MTKELALQVISIMNESRSDSNGSMSDIYARYQTKMNKLFGRSLSDDEIASIELEAVNTSDGENDSPLGSLEMAIARLQLSGVEGFTVSNKEIPSTDSVVSDHPIGVAPNGKPMGKSYDPGQKLVDDFNGDCILVDSRVDPDVREMRRVNNTDIQDADKVVYLADPTIYESEPITSINKVNTGTKHRAGFTSSYILHILINVVFLVFIAIVYKGNLGLAIVFGVVLAFADKFLMELVICKGSGYLMSKQPSPNTLPGKPSRITLSILTWAVVGFVNALAMVVVMLGGTLGAVTLFAVPSVLVGFCLIGDYINLYKYID